MLAIYACTLLIVLASLAIGRAILVALGGPLTDESGVGGARCCSKHGHVCRVRDAPAGRRPVGRSTPRRGDGWRVEPQVFVQVLEPVECLPDEPHRFGCG